LRTSPLYAHLAEIQLQQHAVGRSALAPAERLGASPADENRAPLTAQEARR
jgi:hypothetical protein